MDLKITKKHFSAGRPHHNDFKSCKNEKNNVLISLVEYIVKTFYKICISDLPKCADAYYSLYIQKQPPEVFYKKVFLEISQNSQENTCGSLFLNKAAGLRPATLIKKRL